MSDYIIAESGEFPPKYNVLEKGVDGIYVLKYGPDDLGSAQRKQKELATAGKRARTKKGRYVGDDLSTPDYNEAYVGGKKKAKSKKKAKPKKKAKAKAKKKPAKKKS